MPRKIFIERFSRGNSLAIKETPSENLKPGQLRVRVSYIGVNFADILARRGFYKWAKDTPIVPGFECSGVVTEASDCTQLKTGDRVIAAMRFGAYADEVVLDENRAFKIPDSMSLETACAIPAVYLTSYQALHTVLRIRQGDRVLITAAAGGIGIAAIQLCQACLAKPYGIVSTKQKVDFLKNNFDIESTTYDQASDTLSPGDFDFLLDSLGGSEMKQLMKLLAPAGTCVTIGGANFVPPASIKLSEWLRWLKKGWDYALNRYIDSFDLIESNQGIAGVQLLLLWEHIDHLRQMMSSVLDLSEKNLVQPVLDMTFNMEEAYQAHLRLESRASIGKVLLQTGHSEP